MSFLNLILKIVGLVPILYIPSISPCDAWYWGEWEKIAYAPLNSEYAPSLCLISLPPLKIVIKRNFRPPPQFRLPSTNSELFVLTTPIASQLFSSLPTMTISCVCTLVNSRQWANFTMGPNEQNQQTKFETKSMFIHAVVLQRGCLVWKAKTNFCGKKEEKAVSQLKLDRL